MGLFDKKTCVICGKQFGLIGGISIADGHLCSECRRKLSPYTYNEKKLTTEEIRRHLAYREKNEAALASFSPDKVIGTSGTKFYYDSGKESFLVNNRSNWKDGNPDIVNRSQVVSADCTISESKDEIYKNEEEKISYDPKKYEYEYTFNMKLDIDSPYFEQITFEVRDGDKPDDKNSDDYKKLVYDCKMIQHLLLPKIYEEPVLEESSKEEGDTWTCSCGQAGNTGKFCSACGKERVVTWDCPSCGQKGNTGKFCTGCGKEKSEAVRWFCPECGQENTGKFCSACGTKMPENVRSTPEVKRITPTIKKPGVK